MHFLRSIRFWAALVVLAAFFFLPFLRYTFGFTQPVLTFGFELANSGQLLNYLLWLVPVSSVYIVLGQLRLVQWQQDVARMVLFIVAGYFFLHYGLLRTGAELKHVGLGLWVTVLGAVLIFFEKDIKRAMGRSSQEQDEGA